MLDLHEIIFIVIGAIFVNNIVLAQFLGCCPFLGVSKKLSSAIGMGMAVTFVLTLASVITWLVQVYLLERFDIGYLQTIAFILVIASLVQFVEMVIKKHSPDLYKALGVYLPLITTNCAVLGVALLNVERNYNFIEGLVYAVMAGIGFTIAIVIFASIRERLDVSETPKAFEGLPITLVTAALLSIAFMGFQGLRVW